MTTLQELAERGGSTSRGAAALIEAGFPPETSLDELRPSSVTRTLVEVFAKELAELHERLGEVYENAFVETETRESLERLVDRLEPPRPWWCRWRRRA